MEIKVTFAPMDFSTAHMKLQVRYLLIKWIIIAFTVDSYLLFVRWNSEPKKSTSVHSTD